MPLTSQSVWTLKYQRMVNLAFWESCVDVFPLVVFVRKIVCMVYWSVYVLSCTVMPFQLFCWCPSASSRIYVFVCTCSMISCFHISRHYCGKDWSWALVISPLISAFGPEHNSHWWVKTWSTSNPWSPLICLRLYTTNSVH